MTDQSLCLFGKLLLAAMARRDASFESFAVTTGIEPDKLRSFAYCNDTAPSVLQVELIIEKLNAISEIHTEHHELFRRLAHCERMQCEHFAADKAAVDQLYEQSMAA